jgi:hypothetical protein
MSTVKPYAVVALLEDIPAENVSRGQVGTVIDTLATGAALVEFADGDGVAYATLALQPEQMMELHHRPAGQAA